MDYYIRFCTHEGYERFEPAGDSLPVAIKEAERMAHKCDGVEVISDSGDLMWPQISASRGGGLHDDI